ncbi:MAG: substrate-binding domain-containing protein [Lentisphaerota bacterium]
MSKINFKIEKANPSPVYIQIKDQIKKHIKENKLPYGFQLPTVTAIAENTGFGVRTACKGLDELVREGVCFRRAKKGTYVGDIGKKLEKKKICALWHPGGEHSLESNRMVALFYKGITSVCTENKMDSVFLSGDLTDGVKLYRSISEFEFTGILCLNPSKYDEFLALAAAIPDLKIILVNHIPKNFEDAPDNIHGVFNDEFGGAYSAAERLIDQGKRNFIIMSTELELENFTLRVEGFKKALSDRGVALSKSSVIKINLRHFIDKDKIKRIVREIAEKAAGSSVDAMLCADDIIAGFAAERLDELGKRDAIELFGYDNINPEISAQHSFSTVATDFQRIGEKAAKILAQDSFALKTIKIAPHFIMRRYNK